MNKTLTKNKESVIVITTEGVVAWHLVPLFAKRCAVMLYVSSVRLGARSI